MSTPDEPQSPFAPLPIATLDEDLPHAAADETPSHATADSTGVASLDKVRDILFGVQVRDFERRFARLEDRLVNDTNDLKEEVTRRVDALEQHTTALDEQAAASQREFRQHKADIDHRLIDDIRERVDNVLLTLAREVRELRTEVVDRALVASLFTEMARRLTGDAKTVGAEGEADD